MYSPRRPTAIPIVLCMTALTGCQTVQQRIAARREMTTRAVPAAVDRTLLATVEVLQDRGFVIDETDPEAGLVYARRETTASVAGAFSLLRAVVKREAREAMDDGLSYEMSCVLTPLDDSTTSVRALIVRKSPKASFVEQSGETIYERGLYQRFFDDITAEVQRRSALRDPGSTPHAGAER